MVGSKATHQVQQGEKNMKVYSFNRTTKV